ncbi:hypothetical protein H5410_030108 [Solanum commersonii]|uniref:Uncharacterized protein n=1 Tax=Solanum commersonii TaxID=4109 RepID=A0A9J5YET0_SOLCO|nr:hypothetical protein H5410_030108 [Solanum commersonii]
MRSLTFTTWLTFWEEEQVCCQPFTLACPSVPKAIPKSQYLSLGGRLTLINSALDALPTYMMSIFRVPTNVVDRIDALRRNFLWQGNLIPGRYIWSNGSP